MLVHAQAVEAGLVSVFELVEILVVVRVALDGIVEARGNVDPNAAVTLREILRQMFVRHEVEEMTLHWQAASKSSSRRSGGAEIVLHGRGCNLLSTQLGGRSSLTAPEAVDMGGRMVEHPTLEMIMNELVDSAAAASAARACWCVPTT